MMTSILAAAALAAAPVAELAPVTVYASRTGSDAADIPASVQIFDARDIARSGASDLPDFLKKRAGMDVRGMGGNPLLATVALRGFGDNAFGRTKIVLDGENARSALDDAVIIMDQEHTRKLEEFGYIVNGVKVKDYRIATVEMIEEWIGVDDK